MWWVGLILMFTCTSMEVQFPNANSEMNTNTTSTSTLPPILETERGREGERSGWDSGMNRRGEGEKVTNPSLQPCHRPSIQRVGWFVAIQYCTVLVQYGSHSFPVQRVPIPPTHCPSLSFPIKRVPIVP